MEGGGLYCPVEECEENRGGTCNLKQDGPLGWASMAFFLPGQTNMTAPFMSPVAMPPMAAEWGLWRNCPRLKQRDQKK